MYLSNNEIRQIRRQHQNGALCTIETAVCNWWLLVNLIKSEPFVESCDCCRGEHATICIWKNFNATRNRSLRWECKQCVAFRLYDFAALSLMSHTNEQANTDFARVVAYDALFFQQFCSFPMKFYCFSFRSQCSKSINWKWMSSITIEPPLFMGRINDLAVLSHREKNIELISSPYLCLCSFSSSSIASFHSLAPAFNGPNDVNDIFDTLAEGSHWIMNNVLEPIKRCRHYTYSRTLHSSNFDTFSTNSHYRAIHFIRAISKWAMSNHSFSTGWWQSCFEYIHETEVKIIIVIDDFGYCCNAPPVYRRQNGISHRFIASIVLRSFSSSTQLSLTQLTCKPSTKWMMIMHYHV